MQQIKFYRTYSTSPDGKSAEKRGFETIELAKADAYNDTKDSSFHLFEVTMTFDGKVTESERYLGQLVSGRDFERFAPKKDQNVR